MKAAVFVPGRAAGEYVEVREVARPVAGPGQLMLRVSACGVCRTDLHIVEGDLPALKTDLIPGHQIVGEVIGGATPELALGTRVGVSWMGGVDGTCWFCTHGMENLCDRPTFTGYTVNGGYAEYATVRADFAVPVPAGLDDVQVDPAPEPGSVILLCGGLLGVTAIRTRRFYLRTSRNQDASGLR